MARFPLHSWKMELFISFNLTTHNQPIKRPEFNEVLYKTSSSSFVTSCNLTSLFSYCLNSRILLYGRELVD